MIMVVSRTPTLPISPSLKPKLPIFAQTSLPKIEIHKIPTSTSIKSISLLPATATSQLALVAPSMAAEIEKATLFDFNLTFLIIVAEFLFLMFALDKLYFTPLGDFIVDKGVFLDVILVTLQNKRHV